MTMSSAGQLRVAAIDDWPQLLCLWAMLSDEDDSAGYQPWMSNAQAWFARLVGEPSLAHFPVVATDDGEILATAIGTLELGVPHPQSPQGRMVRLANVISLPEHRGEGYGTLVVRDVLGWARSIGADRVDLSTTPEGRRIYERAGFVLASAPRMKLMLTAVPDPGAGRSRCRGPRTQ
jgi:GNAT superfamily N-acetyltransferase